MIPVLKHAAGMLALAGGAVGFAAVGHLIPSTIIQLEVSTPTPLKASRWQLASTGGRHAVALDVGEALAAAR